MKLKLPSSRSLAFRHASGSTLARCRCAEFVFRLFVATLLFAAASVIGIDDTQFRESSEIRQGNFAAGLSFAGGGSRSPLP